MKQNSKRQAGAKADSSTNAEDSGTVRRHNTNTIVGGSTVHNCIADKMILMCTTKWVCLICNKKL